MNYPGGDTKFRITTKIPDFLLSEDRFEIVVKNQYGRVTHRISKNDCFYDSLGRWYFGIEAVQEGIYFSIFEGHYEDDDYDKQHAVVTDIQRLTEVGRYGKRRRMPQLPPEDFPPGHDVKYEQVWMVSVDGADYLADCDGKYVYTGDGKRIQFTSVLSQQIDDMGKIKMQMTGEEFLKKWEGRDPNGVVDTIPEMFDAARGISDDETIPEHTDQQIEDKLEEDAATNEDIDEMF